MSHFLSLIDPMMYRLISLLQLHFKLTSENLKRIDSEPNQFPINFYLNVVQLIRILFSMNFKINKNVIFNISTKLRLKT